MQSQKFMWLVGKDSGFIMIYLRNFLEDHFVTLTELSNHLGIDRSHLGKLINGKHKSRLSTIYDDKTGMSM